MQWVQASYYLIQATKQNKPVVTILDAGGEPADSYILYDGGEHALFYRSADCCIILDYLAPQSQALIKQSKTLVICEYNAKEDSVRRLYEAPIFLTEECYQIQLSETKGEKNG